MLSVTRLVDSRSIVNLFENYFLPPPFRDPIKSIEFLSLPSLNQEAVFAAVDMPLPIRIDNCCIHVWFERWETPGIEELFDLSSIAYCIHRDTLSLGKIFPWRLRPVAILFTKKTIDNISHDTPTTQVNMLSTKNSSMNEHYLYHINCQTTSAAYLQETVLDSCNGPGLLIIETHWNVIERRCSMFA